MLRGPCSDLCKLLVSLERSSAEDPPENQARAREKPTKLTTLMIFLNARAVLLLIERCPLPSVVAAPRAPGRGHEPRAAGSEGRAPHCYAKCGGADAKSVTIGQHTQLPRCSRRTVVQFCPAISSRRSMARPTKRLLRCGSCATLHFAADLGVLFLLFRLSIIVSRGPGPRGGRQPCRTGWERP